MKSMFTALIPAPLAAIHAEERAPGSLRVETNRVAEIALVSDNSDWVLVLERIKPS